MSVDAHKVGAGGCMCARAIGREGKERRGGEVLATAAVSSFRAHSVWHSFDATHCYRAFDAQRRPPAPHTRSTLIAHSTHTLNADSPLHTRAQR
eukprot:366547-Chlamydomonas_euryale.AAC.10